MDMQNVSNLQIPEGVVRTIHDKDNRLLWGRVAYNTKYAGNTIQNGTPTPDAPIPVQTVTGEQAVTVTGKNLFDKDNANILFGYINASGVIIAGGVNTDAMFYIPCSPNTTYTIQKGLQTTTSKNRFRIGTTQAVPQYSDTVSDFWRMEDGGLDTVHTIVTSSNAKYLVVYCYGNDTEMTRQSLFGTVQVEQGSTATAYEPYQGQSYTIDLGTTKLCKIGGYQDYIYKSGDDWYVHKEIHNYQLTGNENWNRHSSGAFYDRGNSYAANGGKVPANDNTLPNIVSEYFTQGTQNQVFNNRAPGVCVASDNTSNPRFYVNGISTTEDFKDMITIKQPVLYFPLATPTDTKITDATLVGQLNAVHGWLTRYGYSSTATATGNLPIIISKTNL